MPLTCSTLSVSLMGPQPKTLPSQGDTKKINFRFNFIAKIATKWRFLEFAYSVKNSQNFKNHQFAEFTKFAKIVKIAEITQFTEITKYTKFTQITKFAEITNTKITKNSPKSGISHAHFMPGQICRNR